MGRELKRVPLDFDWPLQKVWSGFRNPFYCAVNCIKCDGSGYSPEAKRMKDLWYGYVPFKPEDRGSAPFTPDDKSVRAFAERQIRQTPSYYGRGEPAIARRAVELCRHWNNSWSHHLNEADVAAWSRLSSRQAPIAAHGFVNDLRGMQWADMCLLLLPCGRSAHLEAGWFCGQGNGCVILTRDGEEPELMALLATDICISMDEVLEALK